MLTVYLPTVHSKLVNLYPNLQVPVSNSRSSTFLTLLISTMPANLPDTAPWLAFRYWDWFWSEDPGFEEVFSQLRLVGLLDKHPALRSGILPFY